MGDGDDENARRLDAVEQPVGEASDEGSPESTAERATAVRELEASFVGSPDCEDEVQAQILGVALGIPCGRDELGFRFGMKLDVSY